MKHRTAIALIGVALAATLVFAGCQPQDEIDRNAGQNKETQTVIVKQEPSTPINQMTVSGTGSATAQPDLATIDFSVVTEEKTAEEAEQANSKKMADVIAVLKGAGIAQKDIQSAGFYMNPVYDYSKSAAVLKGYSVQNTVTVKVRAFDKLGAIITDAIAAGANSVSGLSYSLEDSAQYYQQALEAAVKDAAGKAGVLAAASGVTVSAAPITITEQSQSATPLPVPMATREMTNADDSAAVPTEPGEMKITAQVQLIYMIEEAK